MLWAEPSPLVATGMAEPESSKSLAVDAAAHARDKRWIGRVVRNEFHLVEDEIAYPQSDDGSTIKVHEVYGNEVLYIRYNNPYALDI
jgi:hypothetical protein